MDADVRWLERGWDWLDQHRSDAQHDEMEATWIDRLKRYEQAYRLVVERRYDR